MRITTFPEERHPGFCGYILVCAVVFSMVFMASTTVWAFNAGSFPDRQTYLSIWKSFLRGSAFVGRAKHHELATEIYATSN